MIAVAVLLVVVSIACMWTVARQSPLAVEQGLLYALPLGLALGGVISGHALFGAVSAAAISLLLAGWTGIAEWVWSRRDRAGESG